MLKMFLGVGYANSDIADNYYIELFENMNNYSGIIRNNQEIRDLL